MDLLAHFEPLILTWTEQSEATVMPLVAFCHGTAGGSLKFKTQKMITDCVWLRLFVTISFHANLNRIDLFAAASSVGCGNTRGQATAKEAVCYFTILSLARRLAGDSCGDFSKVTPATLSSRQIVLQT